MYGHIIRALRKQRKMTQKELADLLGFDSSSSVAMLEKEVRGPSADILLKLSEIFGVSTDYILGKTVEEQPGEIDKLAQEMDALCTKLSKLPENDRDKLLKMIDIMLEGTNTKK